MLLLPPREIVEAAWTIAQTQMEGQGGGLTQRQSKTD